MATRARFARHEKARSRRPAARGRDTASLGVERFEPRLALAALFPYPLTFSLDSVAGASKTIYLDFTGHRTQGAAWNSPLLANDPDIVSQPFTLDGNANLTFSTTELEFIQEVWARVAEHFRPFDVNVTTSAPAVAALEFGGGADTEWGVRCVVSDASSPNDESPTVLGSSASSWGDSLGGSFKNASDTPCFVNTDITGLTTEAVAAAATHEIGRTLGLGSHGVSSASGLPSPTDPKLIYYGGHTNGQLSWSPLMGNPTAERRMRQWSHGEYATASRPYQDDLAILTNVAGASGFGYRADAVGNTTSAAMPLVFPAGSLVSTVSGIIEQNTDVDMFTFQSPGPFSVIATPFSLVNSATYDGAMLDVGFKVYDAAGSVVAVVEPADAIDAAYSSVLPGGTYYVGVYGTGNADRQYDGYSNYGSLGTYNLAVTLAATPAVFSIQPQQQSLLEGNTGTKSATFVVSLAPGAPAPATPLSVDVRTVDGTAVAGADYAAVSTTVVFPVGTTSMTVTVPILGDTMPEIDEAFFVDLVNPTAGTVVSGTASRATATILNDDGPLLVAFGPSVPATKSLVEGNAPKTTKLSLPVVVNSKSATPLTVSYTLGGTATAGIDYVVLTPGPLTIPAGSLSTAVELIVTGDALLEVNETIVVTLTGVSAGGTLGTSKVHTITINNDDSVTPPSAGTIAVSKPRVREGNSGLAKMTFVLTLSKPSATATDVWVMPIDGTTNAAGRYVKPSAPVKLTFRPRQTSLSYAVNVLSNRLADRDCEIHLQVSRSSTMSPVEATGRGTVLDDDPAVKALAFASLAAETPVTTTRKRVV